VVTLWLDDGHPWGTNSAAVEIQVIAPAQAVAILLGMIENSAVNSRARPPLVASLMAIIGAFERESFCAGVNQLQAFQNKVRTRLAPFDPVLAQQLVAAAQQIIDALGPW
jgi:hypothetical protein